MGGRHLILATLSFLSSLVGSFRSWIEFCSSLLLERVNLVSLSCCLFPSLLVFISSLSPFAFLKRHQQLQENHVWRRIQVFSRIRFSLVSLCFSSWVAFYCCLQLISSSSVTNISVSTTLSLLWRLLTFIPYQRHLCIWQDVSLIPAAPVVVERDSTTIATPTECLTY